MDKASDFGSEDWGFESLQGRFFPLLPFFCSIYVPLIYTVAKITQENFFTLFSYNPNSGQGVILDRSIYSDRVFAKVCTSEGFISSEGSSVPYIVIRSNCLR